MNSAQNVRIVYHSLNVSFVVDAVNVHTCAKSLILRSSLRFVGHGFISSQEFNRRMFAIQRLQGNLTQISDHAVIGAGETRFELSLLQSDLRPPTVFMS